MFVVSLPFKARVLITLMRPSLMFFVVLWLKLVRDVLRVMCCFFFQAEDGIRDYKVTGVQTCALPISQGRSVGAVVFKELAEGLALGPGHLDDRVNAPVDANALRLELEVQEVGRPQRSQALGDGLIPAFELVGLAVEAADCVFPLPGRDGVSQREAAADH